MIQLFYFQFLTNVKVWPDYVVYGEIIGAKRIRFVQQKSNHDRGRQFNWILLVPITKSLHYASNYDYNRW
jgi:hypothetical protein